MTDTADPKRDRLLPVGLIGAAVTAICCFTPLLVVVLGAVGLSVWLGWIDYVLLPTLAGFLALAVYGWVRRTRRRT